MDCLESVWTMFKSESDREFGECLRVRVIVLESEGDRVFGECWRVKLIEYLESVGE